jgi:hypothetical protein
MKTKRALTIATVLVTLAMIITLGVSGAVPYRNTGEYSAQRTSTDTPDTESLPAPVTFKTYKVLPSDTDGASGDCPAPNECPGTGIGCAWCWPELNNKGNPILDNDDLPVSSAPNNKHVLYVPEGTEQTGKLLLFLPGYPGNPDQDALHEAYHRLYKVMASQGYHVLGLSTFIGGFSAFEEFMRELKPEGPTLKQHPQDSLLNRLVKVLEWASANHPEDGWGRYLIDGEVNWAQINLAGFSGGTAYASFMGTLYPVGRVALFAGPNDGTGSSEADWVTADYIQRVAGVTDTRYYGLVHTLNWADRNDGFNPVLYEVIEAWRKFGMAAPLNPEPFWFDPQPDFKHDFMGSHMLISYDLNTSAHAAHASVVLGEYKDCDGIPGCTPKERIGYGPAWRCVLGTGDATASTPPVAHAGPDLRAQCRGNGGATVILDSSRSKDSDCDVLGYGWTGSIGRLGGRNPTVFLPLGLHTFTLQVTDGWDTSTDTMSVLVRDTKPPTLGVTLTPTILSPANHKLVHMHATVGVADKRGGAPPHVVLTSITSSEPDSGVGVGDLAGDIQGADVGTLDQSFVLRAEAFGSGRHARTYTITCAATDSSGNSTQFIGKVHVTNSRSR